MFHVEQFRRIRLRLGDVTATIVEHCPFRAAEANLEAPLFDLPEDAKPPLGPASPRTQKDWDRAKLEMLAMDGLDMEAQKRKAGIQNETPAQKAILDAVFTEIK